MLASVEERRDQAQAVDDQRHDAEQAGRQRRAAVGGQQAELVGPLQLVLGHQVGHRRGGGRVPEQRGDAGEELRDVDPGQVREQRDGQEQQAAGHVTDDHRHPAVEPVGQRARDRAEQQRRAAASPGTRRRPPSFLATPPPLVTWGASAIRARIDSQSPRLDRESAIHRYRNGLMDSTLSPERLRLARRARRPVLRAIACGRGAEVHGVRVSTASGVPGGGFCR